MIPCKMISLIKLWFVLDQVRGIITVNDRMNRIYVEPSNSFYSMINTNLLSWINLESIVFLSHVEVNRNLASSTQSRL